MTHNLCNAILMTKQIPAFAPVINHIALYVSNINRSTLFYRDVLGFGQVAEPFKDGNYAWFSIGFQLNLHLIAGAAKVKDHHINTHLAFSVSSLGDFMAHLDALNILYRSAEDEYKKFSVRPDGARQIFLQDPDGYWLEINDCS